MISPGRSPGSGELIHPPGSGLSQHYTIAYPIAASTGEPERIVISLEEVVLLIKKHFFKAVLVGLVVAVLAFSFFQFRDPLYEVSTLLRIEPSSKKALNLNTLDKQMSYDDTVADRANTYRVEIGSTKFKKFFFEETGDKELINQFLAGLKPGLKGRIVGFFTSFLPAEEEQGESSSLDTFLAGMEGEVWADPVKETHLLRISLAHSDPEVAARFINAYTESFLRYLSAEDKRGMEQATVFLGEKLEDLLRRVKAKEQELLEFRRSERLVSNEDPAESEIKGVESINARIVDAKLRVSHLQNILSRIEGADENREALLSIDEIAALPGVEAVQKKHAEKSAELIALESSYLGSHSRVIQVKREVNGLETQLRRLIDDAVAQLEAELKTELARLEAASSAFLNAENTALDQQQKELKQDVLEMQLTAERNLYDRLSTQLSEAQVALQFSGTGDIRLAEHATAPRKPIKPRFVISSVMSLIAFGFGFVGFPVAAFSVEYLRGLLKRADEFEGEKSSVPVEKAPAVEPGATAAQTAGPTGTDLPTIPRDPRNLLKMPVLAAMDSSELIRLGIQSDTPHGRAIHDFNAALLQDSRFPTLLVTSANPREGKTLISIALACSAAAAGRKVFLIEANEMNPSLQEWFRNQQVDPGRVDCVADALEKTKVGSSGLHVITRNHWRSNYGVYSELLSQAPSLCDAVYLDGPSLIHDDAWAFQRGNCPLAVVVRDTQRPPQGPPGLATAQALLAGNGTRVLGEISNRNSPPMTRDATLHFANCAS